MIERFKKINIKELRDMYKYCRDNLRYPCAYMTERKYSSGERRCDKCMFDISNDKENYYGCGNHSSLMPHMFCIDSPISVVIYLHELIVEYEMKNTSKID